MSDKQMTDDFLRKLVEDGKNVSVYLVNGIKLQGKLVGFDDLNLLLAGTGTQNSQLVGRHAYSTVQPQ